MRMRSQRRMHVLETMWKMVAAIEHYLLAPMLMSSNHLASLFVETPNWQLMIFPLLELDKGWFALARQRLWNPVCPVF